MGSERVTRLEKAEAISLEEGVAAWPPDGLKPE
jgi:hypothetical protein